MTENSIASFAPIRVTVEFELSDGNQTVQASFGCPLGEIPTEANIAEAAASVLAQVRGQLGGEFYWQSRHGFLGAEFAERTGGARIAVPGTDQWKAEWAQ